MKLDLAMKRLAWVGVSLCLLVFGAEAVLKIGLGLGNPVLIVTDSRCGYMLKPEQDVRRFFRHTHVNRFGMRSEEVGPKGNALRILFVGDSIPCGTTRVDQRDIFTDIFRRELPSLVGRPVQVLNACAGGWAIGNEVEYVRSRGTFDSDLVVLVLNSGDLSQRFATLSDVGDELPVTKPASALAEVYARYVKPKLRDMLHDKSPRADAGTTERRDEAAVRRNIASLDTLARTVEEDGAKLAVIFIPFRQDVAERVQASEPEELTAWAEAKRVPTLDLTSSLLPHTTKEVTLDGMHLNRQGNRIVAEALERQWERIAQ